MLFAIGAGDQIVARTDFCNFPLDVASIKSLGGFDGKTFSIESVIAQEPDFVYLFTVMHDHLIPTLEKYGIQYYVSDATTIEDVINEIKEVGILTGHEVQAKKVADEISSTIEAISKTTSSTTKTPTVYWEIWNSPYMSIGNTSFIDEIITAAGGKNIFADIDQGYPTVSEESIIARNPDVIIIPSDSPLSADDVKARKGWANISAVKNNNVYKVDADITSRAGPRVKDAIILINECLFN